GSSLRLLGADDRADDSRRRRSRREAAGRTGVRLETLAKTLANRRRGDVRHLCLRRACLLSCQPGQRRRLRLADLRRRLQRRGVELTPAPTDWTPRDPNTGLTVDEVELLLDKGEVHQTLPAAAHEAMRNILTTLEERAGQPSMSRKLRRLEIPESVSVTYKS